MLQYVIEESDKWSVAELAQMAIEGGCRWLTLKLAGLDDGRIRELLSEGDVVEMCREAGVFLTVDDRPELARQMGLHGVRLTAQFFVVNPQATAVQVREELGPEAIIGLEVTDPSLMGSLAGADLDFVMMPSTVRGDGVEHYVSAVNRSGFALPVVAQNVKTIDDCLFALGQGCAGVCVSEAISASSEPVESMRTFIDALNAYSEA